MERDRTEMMAMQAVGELGEQGIFGISGEALDYELLARYPQRQRGPLLQEVLRTPGDARRRGVQRRMALRVHGVLMEGNRELNKEVCQLPGEGGPFRLLGRLAGGGGHGLHKIASRPVRKLTFAKRNSPGIVSRGCF